MGGGRVVVVGEALVDLVPATCDGDDGLVPRPGGSPFNVAVAAARLGAPTTFVGRISSDAFGALLTRTLEAEGVATDRVVATDDPTTLAVVSLDERGGATYGFYLTGTSAFGLTHDRVRLDDAAIVHVSCGAVLLDADPAGTALRSTIAEADGLTSFDPNVRPQFADDLATYARTVDTVAAACDLVKVSDEDLRVLHPQVEPLEVARAWADAGPRLVVVTRGAEGATAVGPGLEREVAVAGRDRGPVADTVGAGDSFSGGLVAWLHEHGVTDAGALGALDAGAVADALGFAADVAAVTVTRVGADPPRRAELG